MPTLFTMQATIVFKLANKHTSRSSQTSNFIIDIKNQLHIEQHVQLRRVINNWIEFFSDSVTTTIYCFACNDTTSNTNGVSCFCGTAIHYTCLKTAGEFREPFTSELTTNRQTSSTVSWQRCVDTMLLLTLRSKAFKFIRSPHFSPPSLAERAFIAVNTESRLQLVNIDLILWLPEEGWG